MDYLSKCISKNITKVKNIFLGQDIHFGNKLILIENVILFCRILGCKTIILDKTKNWFIQKTIIIKKYKLIIKIDEEKNVRHYFDIIIDNTLNFFYLFYEKSFINAEITLNLIKSEILRNLPTVEINKEDIYIYIRSGDVFENNNYSKNYVQPPF